MNTVHKSLSKRDIIAAYQAVCDVSGDLIRTEDRDVPPVQDGPW